jgi:outer membrane immunogenic protein
MKSLFTASVSALALIAGLVSVQAADIQQRAVVKAPPIVAPVFTWTGPYVGISGGYGWGESRSFEVDGALLGVTAGYNWQMNQFVFGVEGDLSWSDISGSGPCGAGTRCTVDNSWLGTARGRLGWAAGQFMPYVTGGLAFGDIDVRRTGFGRNDSTEVGWVLGAGVEAALWGPVSAKIEYLYVDLGNGPSVPGPGGGSADFQTSIVRAGLNYRF